MSLFYKNALQMYKPCCFSAGQIVLSLSKLIKNYKEFLQEAGIDLDLLELNIKLEKEDLRLIGRTLTKENIGHITRRRMKIYDSYASGKYKSKKIYTNVQIKDMAKKIWH